MSCSTENIINKDCVHVSGTLSNNIYLSPKTSQYIPAWIAKNENVPFLNNPGLFNVAVTKLLLDTDNICEITPHRILINSPSLPVVNQHSNNGFSFFDDILIDNGLLNITYIPNQYKLVPLVDSLPLTDWDIKLYIEYKDGIVSPLMISPEGRLDVELLFLKKGLTS